MSHRESFLFRILLLTAFAAILYLLAITEPHAGSRYAQARSIHCERVAMGAWFRSNGFANVVRWMPREQMPDDKLRDAIYIRDDGETDEQKARWRIQLLTGWDLENDWMVAHQGVEIEPRLVYEDCLRGVDS